MRKQPTANRLLERIKEARNNGSDKVPPGFFTLTEWASKLELSIPGATHAMKTALANGLVERKRFKVRCGDFLRAAYHYREL